MLQYLVILRKIENTTSGNNHTIMLVPVKIKNLIRINYFLK